MTIVELAEKYREARRAEMQASLAWRAALGAADDAYAAWQDRAKESAEARDALVAACDLDDDDMAASEEDAIAAMQARGIDVGLGETDPVALANMRERGWR